jgi:hypothetical protein
MLGRVAAHNVTPAVKIIGKAAATNTSTPSQ